MVYLIIGDIHAPHRETDIPEEFKSLLSNGSKNISKIFVTGNLCTKTQYDYLKSLCSDIHISRGEFDEQFGSINLEEEVVIQLDDYKIGLIHGHQIVPWGDKESLGVIQRRLDVDILISGHTHEASIWVDNGKLFINPGTASGAYSGLKIDTIPSFVLMDIKDNGVIELYVYKLIQGSVNIGKVEYNMKELK